MTDITRIQSRALLINELNAAIDLIDNAYSRPKIATEDVMTLSDLRVKCDTLRAALTEMSALADIIPPLFDAFIAAGMELTALIRRELTSTTT